jgi:hypothetical protein
MSGAIIDIVGRLEQLGAIHRVNTLAYLEAARHGMLHHGEYTDAEVDVLCEYTSVRVRVLVQLDVSVVRNASS